MHVYITFSSIEQNSSPLFEKLLGTIIFPDLVKYHIAVFVYKYHHKLQLSFCFQFLDEDDEDETYI